MESILNRPPLRYSALAGVVLTASLISGCSGDKDSTGLTDSASPSASATSAPSASSSRAETSVIIDDKICDPLTTGKVVTSDGMDGFCEEQQATGGADVFKSYATASGATGRLAAGATVVVTCVAKGPVEAAPSAKGTWYQIAEPGVLAGQYVAANAFLNVTDRSIPFEKQPAVDPRVPAC